MRTLSRLLTPALLTTGVLAFPSYRLRLPNGKRVPCPEGVNGCTSGDVLEGQPESVCFGLGHNSCQGGTLPLNPFGKDFEEAGSEWTVALCEKDSDGDGQTNGEEMGDPCCKWVAGDRPSPYMSRFVPSHPGFSSHKQQEGYAKPSCESSDTMPLLKAA